MREPEPEPGSESSSGDEAAAEGPGDGPVLKLNVGGARFRIGRRLAARFPASRIGRLAACRGPAEGLRLCDDYSAERDEFFFDRDPGVFRGLWAVYRGGRPWPGPGLCPRGYRAELRYWGLRPGRAPRCCRLLLRERRDELAEEQRVSRQLEAVLGLAEPRAAAGCLGGGRRRLWRLLERPHSSPGARALAVAGCLCVLLSLACLILGTVPELGPGLRGPEAACSAALSAHYLLRLLAAPEPRRFLLAPLNAADLLALLPFYTELALPADPRAPPGPALAALRPLRLLRVLTLARYSTGVRAFGFTLRRCSQQVCCLLLFIGLGIFTFSALVHQAEHHLPGTNFSSIPGTWWWAAVSISTVGYGDTIPETLLGRVFAFGCISFGIILNGMPISIFFNKFSDYYGQLKALERGSVLRDRGHVALRHRALGKLLRCCGDQAQGRRPDSPR
ncbi:potassium voltage-gated channel subfamily V member 2-like [Pristis pectinata]|uniref:potassium voltage-gated channel subfamily V member 2-like n=1 Tax=Pristis pectinata TaxID=685728 RepID=UPI00223DE3DF|nr:potassium voltage-gated channel subfamily V member 2-like [Pristis pectinata]